VGIAAPDDGGDVRGPPGSLGAVMQRVMSGIIARAAGAWAEKSRDRRRDGACDAPTPAAELSQSVPDGVRAYRMSLEPPDD
jgi:hypothetical protein